MTRVLIEFPSEYWVELVENARGLSLSLEEYLGTLVCNELTCPHCDEGLVVKVLPD